MVCKAFPAFQSHLKRRPSPQERREKLQGRSTIPRVPQISLSIPGKPVFPPLPRLSSRGSTHTTVARGTALRKILEGKPHWKASRESCRSLDTRYRKCDTASTDREEIERACPHSRLGLTNPGRLQKYPMIHVSTGEESSRSGTDSTQGLRPRHRRERKPKRPPSNSHGDWPFLRPPDRVPEVPVVSRQHLPQLEKIQEVLPSRRDEAHFRCGVSRLITPNLWNFQRVLHTLAAIQEVPRHSRLQSRGSTRLPPTSRGALFPPPSSRGGILSLRVRERSPGVPVASQVEALSTGKAKGTPGSCNHSQSPPDVSVHSRETCFPCTASTFKPRIDSHHGGTWDGPAGKPRGKASWESLEGKQQIPLSTRREA